ncbi:MAG TPA: VWA domain-containing protein [Acidobacteriaceae bacterium]|nr:VWA domain-containing protein [Acidobacteriaceae bacterium]
MSQRCAILLTMATTAAFAAAQQPASEPRLPSGQQPNAYTLQVKAQEIVLDLVVTDSKGEPVTNLKRDDFQIYEDKIPQVIDSLTPPPSHTALSPAIHSTAELDRAEPDAPVTLIVLDEINTRFQDEAFARYSVKRFLDGQGDTLEHPTLLAAVDLNRLTLLSDYTTSKKDMLSALDRHFIAYPWHTEGTSWQVEQFDASFMALLEMAEATSGHPGHKSLLWIGRGFPPFDPSGLTAPQSQALKQVIEACTNALRDSRVSLYTLDPAGVSTEPPVLDSDGFADDPFAQEVDFDAMARATGGHAFFGRNDVDKVIARSARDGASFYTLAYRPSVPRTDIVTFHNIRVVVKQPGLRAETRQGYYSASADAPPAAATEKQPDLQRLNFTVAAQSMMVYDAVHMSVEPVAGNPNEFRMILNAGDLTWQESGPGKLNTRVTVAAKTFSKKAAVDGALKISTLQVNETSAGKPATSTVSLLVDIPTKGPAVRVRFLVRDEGTGKLGAINYSLSTASSAR